jgi:hypothetical protein
MFVLHFFNFSDTRLWGNSKNISVIPIKTGTDKKTKSKPTRSLKCQSSH